MKTAAPRAISSTIRFCAKLETDGSSAALVLPKDAGAKVPQLGTAIEATLNGFPFRAKLASDGQGGHRLRVDAALQAAADAVAGDGVMVEITRVGEEPELRVPSDLSAALAAAPQAQALWTEITPAARRDWILWISSGKQAETRAIRIGKACSMLAAGKRRVCCFGGLNWLRKDHPKAGENWLPLPKPGP
ncbi:MAG TPA: YdeI/OmpD-associated family protein [Opitutaceae bacterium]|nr:YdeI/OmpD-associated family protein [Opitutaceae bacterium]